MADKKLTFEDKYANLIDALADFAFEMSDEEIRKECKDEGIDLQKEAARTKNIMLEAVKTHRKRRLQLAKQSYENKKELYQREDFSLPKNRERIIDLLKEYLQIGSDLPQGLVLQFREGKNLESCSDQELYSLLKQLKDHGMIDGGNASEG